MSNDSAREDPEDLGNSPNSADAPTRIIDSIQGSGSAKKPTSPQSSRSATSYDSIDDARFVPGAMLAEGRN